MASVNQANQNALVQAIKQQVLDKLEQTLDIVITKEMRNALLKATPHGRHVAPASNGEVHAPEGVKCAAIWHELDKRKAAGKDTSLDEIRAIGVKKGWNEHTTRIQFYRWRHAQEA